jgi:hypothetical protein
MKLVLASILIFCSITILAQQRTFLKTNVLGLAANSYTIEAERTITKRLSIGASYRTMPVSSIPQVERIITYAEITEPEAKDALRKAKMGNSAINIEARMYLGKKGYGRGFYIGGYFRNTKFELNTLPVSVDDGAGGKRNINTTGNFKINGGGLLIGTQFHFGGRFILDWQIFGIGAGSANLTLNSQPSPPLTATEQTDLRNSLQDLQLPGVKVTSTVTANNVIVNGTGTMPWLRTALSIGIKF